MPDPTASPRTADGHAADERTSDVPDEPKAGASGERASDVHDDADAHLSLTQTAWSVPPVAHDGPDDDDLTVMADDLTVAADTAPLAMTAAPALSGAKPNADEHPEDASGAHGGGDSAPSDGAVHGEERDGDAWGREAEGDGIGREAPSADRVGAYRLVRLLGQGGMGQVYLAERADGQFHQRVALKRLRRDLGSNVTERFLAERQILARLQHPGIAHLLDGGVTDGGHPYLVMEYVEGEPITDYCARHRLGIDARLRLVVQVCEAVQHAHRNLVVHRDLKPSNILVGEGPDGAPRIKLLDFGIAKVLARDEHLPMMETQTGQYALTPAFAAPEQVQGEPVTPATDVYALGLLLYRLLAGCSPFDGDTPIEMARATLEEAPTRPSLIVERHDPDAPPRGLPPGPPTRLRRQLAGDLDTIVLKALRKEPERRYGTAGELGRDLERYLDQLPIEARPDTVKYRARKFVGRNRAIVVAAALAFVALLIGFGAAVWQASVASLERNRAEAAAVSAQREADKSQAVTSFLVELFEATGPEEALGDTLTAQALMLRGRRRIATTLADEPEAQGRLLATIGDIYTSLGSFEQADTVLTEALAVQRATLEAPHRDLAVTYARLGEVYVEQGRYAKADSLHRRALAMRRALVGASHPLVAESLRGLALARGYQDRFPEADSLLDAAVAVYRRIHGEAHPAVVSTLADRGWLRARAGDFARAEAIYRDALDASRTALPEQHPVRSDLLNGLAYTLAETGEVQEAEDLYRQALDIERALLGPSHPAVGATHVDLARLLIQRGSYRRAESHLWEAMDIYEGRLQPTHPQHMETRVMLATALAERERYDDAASLLREVVADERERSGPEHPRVAGRLAALARVLRRAERTNALVAVYRDMLPILDATDTPLAYARAMVSFGDALTDRGAYDEAETVLLAGHRLLVAAEAGEDELNAARVHLAELYETTGEAAKAGRWRALSGTTTLRALPPQ